MTRTEHTVYHTPQANERDHRGETVVDESRSVVSTPGDTLRSFVRELSLQPAAASSPASVFSQKRVLEIKSHRVSGYSGHSEGSHESSVHQSQQSMADTQQHKLAMAALEDRIQDQEDELMKANKMIQDAKAVEAARQKEIKDLNASLCEANESMRCLRVELDALNARHAESVRLSETYIAEARLSRDEEVARVEEQLDAVKGITGELRQENEVLKSQMKKMEQSKRDAERELQRAVNRFEAAVQSLEQLEHQYSLLEKDAQETEAAKMERILSLEQEVEDLRVAKGNTAKRLEQSGEALKEAEQRQLKAEEAREDAVAERTRVQGKLERLEALVEKVTSENQALMASQAKLQGASDGAAELTRSMQSMLQTYERENAALVKDLSDVRGRLAVIEERRREEQDALEETRARAGKAERQLEEQAREMAKREEELTSQMDAMRRNHESQETVWKAEQETLKRELELVVGQLSVARIADRSERKDRVGAAATETTGMASVTTGTKPPASVQTPTSQTYYSADEQQQSASASMSVSIGVDGIPMEKTESALETPIMSTSRGGDSGGDHRCSSRVTETLQTTPTTQMSKATRTSLKADEKQDLKAQLNALKLSLLSDGQSARTTGLSKVSGVGGTSTITPLSGYLQAHRPLAMPRNGASNLESVSSSDGEEEEDVLMLEDQLDTARSRIHRAKSVLRRTDRRITDCF